MGNINIVRALVKAGANITLTDNNGVNAFGYGKKIMNNYFNITCQLCFL